MAITTDTVTLKRALEDVHIKCNKEAEIATLATEVRNIKSTVDKMDGKLDKIDKYVSRSEGEKNIIMAVIGIGSSLFGAWMGKGS
jgi:peptidoglycan hydrolase CwlO-like protein